MKTAPCVLLSCCVTLTLLSPSATPQTAPAPAARTEDRISSLMRGEQYQGPVVATPRGPDGKPELTGFWRPLREPGKPGGNLGKDEPDFKLPFNERGQRAQLYTQNHTVDPEAQCVLGGWVFGAFWGMVAAMIGYGGAAMLGLAECPVADGNLLCSCSGRPAI